MVIKIKVFKEIWTPSFTTQMLLTYDNSPLTMNHVYFFNPFPANVRNKVNS